MFSAFFLYLISYGSRFLAREHGDYKIHGIVVTQVFRL